MTETRPALPPGWVWTTLNSYLYPDVVTKAMGKPAGAGGDWHITNQRSKASLGMQRPRQT